MPSLFASYVALIGAICLEVVGSAFLLRSDGFTKLPDTLAMAVLYLGSFYCLSIALRALPLGLAYAVWAGLGIVLTVLVGTIVFKQSLDFPAVLGIGFIVVGVVILNGFSKMAGH